jgi:outer membrane protein TolC
MLSLFPGWEEEDATNRPAISFSLPIPLWNRNQLAIAEATAQRDAAKAALEAGYEELAQARLRADVARKAAAQRREQLESTLVPACKEQLADNRRLAELGELDPLLLLDAVTRLYEAQRSALDAAADEADAIAAENSLFWPQEAAPQALAEVQATNLQPNPR